VRTIAAAAALLALLALAAAIFAQADGTAQEGLSIGVDADAAGNTATSLGSIDSCVSVKKGDTFQIDIFATDVVDLVSWEMYFSFDGDVVNVTDRDVEMLPAASAGSTVWDASDVLPSTGGLYRVAAIDVVQPPAPETGSGVLARLTLKAVAAGLSPAILTSLDANNDGKLELGPLLNATEGRPIGDANGDSFFDGPILGAQIAVGRDCPPGVTGTPLVTVSPPALSPTNEAAPSPTSPTPARPDTTASPTSPRPSDGSDGTNWTSGGFIAMYVVIGSVAALLLGGGAFLVVTRRRGP
jgi:hypothetical protein